MDIIYKNSDSVTLYQGDCIETMRTLPDNSVDSIVTDPPYELGFMNKSWDSTGIANNVEMWKECLRVLKPGGHLLSFGGTRTYHRMACAIEDAGFEIRDQMQWLYGSGFPKGQDIGKQIDKSLGVKRDVVGIAGKSGSKRNCMSGDFTGGEYFSTKPGTDEARRWDGWNTQLKPSHEPICLARKPISKKTVAENVLKWGTGGLNIDACRIPVDPSVDDMLRETTRGKRATETWEDGSGFKNENNHLTGVREDGRFPANIIFDEEAGRLLDEQAPKTGAFAPVKSGYNGESNGIYGDYSTKGDDGASFHADGLQGASRFFKSIREERLYNYLHANIVGENLIPIHAISENIAQMNVMDYLKECLVHLVKFVESQCDHPATNIAQKVVVTEDSQEDKQLKNILTPFIKEMLKISRQNSVTDTLPMMNSGKKCVQELRRISTEMLSECPVNSVAIQRLINTMAIIQSLLSIDGFAEDAISDNMFKNMVLGGQDCRFIYQAKTSKSERNAGLNGMDKKTAGSLNFRNPSASGRSEDAPSIAAMGGLTKAQENFHPTVKPVKLMEYLVKLITPPGGIVLDPFMGSGSTGIAAKNLDFKFIGIEMDKEYCEIAQKRIAFVSGDKQINILDAV